MYSRYWYGSYDHDDIVIVDKIEMKQAIIADIPNSDTEILWPIPILILRF